jgi:tRNA-specific 2-thiouridylase
MASKKKRVMVAMSGGVDSSVALAILKDEGYDCIGVSMQLWDYSRTEDPDGATPGSCCSLDDIADARRVADALEVPFYVLNMEEAFSREVVDYFVESYLGGTTPNPCIKCNQELKFDLLLKKAVALEADYLATGHYARILSTGDGPRLLRGVDRQKDQSYFLFTMTATQLSKVLFPVGALTKQEVRARARALGLRTSEKKESQEICFVDESGYADFMTARAENTKAPPPAPGEIRNSAGAAIGEHKGLFHYTIGQRKGLNISKGGGPFYVTEIDTLNNRLVVGAEADLLSSGLIAREVNCIDPAALGADGVTAKIRYRHADTPVKITHKGGAVVRVEFEEPQRSVTPGQAVVFYNGEMLIGGGWIVRAIK